jgi:hypothetical protein
MRKFVDLAPIAGALFGAPLPGSVESDSDADHSACEVSDYDSEYERKDGCELFVQEPLSTYRLTDFSERIANSAGALGSSDLTRARYG